MKINDFLMTLNDMDRQRMIGRLEGMTMAMRIARNRAADVVVERGGNITTVRHIEAENIAAMIRLVQVQIGSGAHEFGELTTEELDEIYRIF